MIIHHHPMGAGLRALPVSVACAVLVNDGAGGGQRLSTSLTDMNVSAGAVDHEVEQRRRESNPPPSAIRHGKNASFVRRRIPGCIPDVSRSGTMAGSPALNTTPSILQSQYHMLYMQYNSD
jgi:hypothetical protein